MNREQQDYQICFDIIPVLFSKPNKKNSLISLSKIAHIVESITNIKQLNRLSLRNALIDNEYECLLTKDEIYFSIKI